MTPARLNLPAGWHAWPAVALSLVLLNLSLTFVNVWPTPKIQLQNAVSIELAVCVLLLALLPHAGRAFALRVLPLAWLLLVVGRYLDVTAPALYGRAFNLYWDAPHLGNVVAMITEAAPVWQLVMAAALAALVITMSYAVSRTAFGWIAGGATRPQLRTALIVLASLGVVLFTSQQLRGEPALGIRFAEPVSPSYIRQTRSVLAMLGPGSVAPSLGRTPAAFGTRPPRLGDGDVYLVFVESYGAVTFDLPTFAAALAPSRAAFEAAARDTGRQIVSAFVESPTFGASSWLAHLSLLSGVRVQDQYSYQALMTDFQRGTLGTTFQRAGYRAVALMPGMRQAWPEGAFYRYDAMYGRDDLAYEGPRFGWWSIPDQYALAKLDALEGAPGTRGPIFVVFPTSTSHAPFGPVPPYQPDWSRVLGADAYSRGEVDAILARPPDLTNLPPEYLRAMSYEFLTFAGYLRQREDEFTMVLVGDHQPPAAVAGKDAPWTVPVHVVTKRADTVARLEEVGFRRGLTPARPSVGEMHELGPILLAALATGAADNTER